MFGTKGGETATLPLEWAVDNVDLAAWSLVALIKAFNTGVPDVANEDILIDIETINKSLGLVTFWWINNISPGA